MDLQKILKIVAIVIGVISIFFLGSILSAGDEAIKAGQSSGTVNVFMYVSYSILAVAVLIVLAFTVLNLVSNTSGLKNTLIGIGAFVVLSLICYFGFANGVESSLKDGNILSNIDEQRYNNIMLPNPDSNIICLESNWIDNEYCYDGNFIFILPIPNSEILANSIIQQNPGYSN